MVQQFGFELDGIRAIEPAGFLGFLQLEAGARLALTDSDGGPEGDAHPGRAVRDAAGEHGEAGDQVEVGANVLAGTGSEKIMNCAMRMLETDTRWKNPFGDGHTGEGIVKIAGY